MMRKNILLLGGVLPVLHFLRRLQPFGLRVEVISGRSDVVAWSKFGVKKLFTSPATIFPVVEEWIGNNKHDNESWLVIPCSEMFVGLVRLFREADFDVFALAEDSLDIFADKKKFYPWLNTLGVSPGEFYNLDDELPFSNNEKYIVKTAKTTSSFESSFKTAFINTAAEHEEIVQKVPQEYLQNYIVQRLYGESQSISYGGAWQNGREIASMVVQQQRQYPKGVTSAAQLHQNTRDIDLIRNVINKIASEKELNGFIELEFIKNEQGLIPIDLNPRLWGWSSFLFMNYPRLAESIALGHCEALECLPVESWSNLWRDVPAIIKHEELVAIKFKTLLSLFQVRRIEFICWYDMKPEIFSLMKKAL